MLARGHGAERAKVPGYSLATVILEYRILRRAVVTALSVTEPLDQGDGEIIIDAFEEAMQDAALEYTAYAHSLVKADEHKSELLAVVCHELRSPLACIQNALFILEIEGVSERSQRQVEAANRQMRKITRILSDLIDIASIAEGKVALRMTPITIENVINDAISTVLPLIEGRDQKITLTIASHGIIINGDADRLEQIMLNLLNNSAKYTEAGGKISVALDTENEEAVIRVKDTGIGIDPMELPKVFDMFHQVAPGTVPSGDGVGIGLGVVKRLAELHGGSVCVDSRGRGLGSEFTLRLPLFGV
jgi:signal transduction histidine kinase